MIPGQSNRKCGGQETSAQICSIAPERAAVHYHGDDLGRRCEAVLYNFRAILGIATGSFRGNADLHHNRVTIRFVMWSGQTLCRKLLQPKRRGMIMRRLQFMGIAVIGLAISIGAASALPGSTPSTNALGGGSTSNVAAIAVASGAEITEAAANDDRDRITCRDRVVTGSRLADARDCHTRTEWDQITRATRDYINGQQLKGLNAAPPND
jgi:hypothetical protein